MSGVPTRLAVPSPLSVKVTPLGSAPDSEIAAVGFPDVVTVKLLWIVSAKLAVAPDVIVGDSSTVRTNDCEAELPTPLEAPKEIG